MRLLILSHAYRPVVSPRAFRWTALAEYWAAQGHQVDVVAGWLPGLPQSETVAEVQIRRVGGRVVESIRSRLRRPPRVPGSQEATVGHRAGRSILGSLAKAAHDTVWKNVYWPDYTCLWYFSALATAHRMLRAETYDALLTVSIPFTAHLVGLRLKHLHPGLRWIVDIGDPFCFAEQTPANNTRLYRRLNYRVERRVLERADSIAVTTEATRSQYLRLVPGIADKIGVVPPLAPTCEDPGQQEKVPSGKPIKLVFVGTLYKSIRSPMHLLQLFQALRNTPLGDRLELHFVGSLHDCGEVFEPYRALIDKQIFLHGSVSREAAIRHMLGASLLVNIGNSTAYQLPSKVVEYACLRRPVLNLVRIANDSSAEFFSRYPAALTLRENDGSTMAEHASRVVQFLDNLPRLDWSVVESWLDAYRIHNVAAAYKSLCLGTRSFTSQCGSSLERGQETDNGTSSQWAA